jgi:hypothetical protein
MPSDIEETICAVRATHPDMDVWRMVKFHPADDDHLWYFSLPDAEKHIHIESASEQCPFWMEHSEMRSGAESVVANSVEEAARFVSDFLAKLRTSPPP